MGQEAPFDALVAAATWRTTVAVVLGAIFKMRTLEGVGIAGLMLCGGALLLQLINYQIAFGCLVFVVALIIGCHVELEGWRWQMAPAYVLTTVLVIYEGADVFWGYQAPTLVGAVVISFALAALVACVVMPVFALPAPSGPYAIGTQTRCVVDESRREQLSDDPNAKRELVIQIWYPASVVEGKRSISPYRDRRITTLKSSHLALIKTHSTIDAHMRPSPYGYPLLLYTPSWSGIRTECTIQIEEMVSHGYVVVAIDHPYSSNIVAFPDGRIVKRRFRGDEDYSSDEAVDAFLRVADEQVRLRAEDARFVLDALEGLNQSDPQGLLTRALSLDHVGIFGFSLGGGTAAQACAVDGRFKAGLNMGGMIAGVVPSQGTAVPFFFMFEGIYATAPYVGDVDTADRIREGRREVKFARRQFDWMKASLERCGGYWLTIDGISHLGFCDAAFFSPLRSYGTNPLRAARIISRYSLAFWDKRLRGIKQPILDEIPICLPGASGQAWEPECSSRRQQRD